MTRDGPAHYDFLIVCDVESAVVFSQAFIKPKRYVTGRGSNQQMCVFVKDNREGILFATQLFDQLQCDVIHVRAGLKIAGIPRAQLKRPVRLVVFEYNNSSGNW